ncbi:hypothetical protein OHB39_36445 [Streptomyces sp. NBC_00047]|uniref:hypothetical protein n=1 Tax=Streptomyces sp. NBC_00047 TaxID=2975627 RepID=UPI00224EC386|nr:hypothetical protein [Streptomyces sp. NBC_00047]MCX5613004.1 hypothetical protein [Streptomyces sp. NBC_00047]
MDLCRACAEGCGPAELEEALESSAVYVAALANLRAEPALAGLGPEEDRPLTP